MPGMGQIDQHFQGVFHGSARQQPDRFCAFINGLLFVACDLPGLVKNSKKLCHNGLDPGMRVVQKFTVRVSAPREAVSQPYGHCDAMAHDDPALDFDYYEQILDFGAIMEFDLLGWGDVFFDDAIRVARLAELIRRGHADCRSYKPTVDADSLNSSTTSFPPCATWVRRRQTSTR
jgi:hypothetical protein